MREFILVNPAELHVPSTRLQGADPGKLQRQISRYGSSLVGMPPIEVIRGKNGHLQIFDGVTRATRAARFRPGELIRAEVTQTIPSFDVTLTPQLKDVLP